MDGITDSMDVNLGKLWDMVRDEEAWRATVHGIDMTWRQNSNNNIAITVCQVLTT